MILEAPPAPAREKGFPSLPGDYVIGQFCARAAPWGPGEKQEGHNVLSMREAHSTKVCWGLFCCWHGCLSQVVQDLIKSDSWMKEHKYPKLKHAIEELKAGHK